MATKTAYLKNVNGITMDGPVDFGGSNAGIRPKELILLSLGGCTGSDVAVILTKKKIKYDKLEMNISAEMKETHPQIYTKIHIEFVIYGKDIPEEAVKRAIELSQNTYCSVTAMLNKVVEITHSYKILES